ncbi:MAG TPA: Uma2 family endonuclease [Oscillatoriaceae cyanobacterium M33_DOE_052]|uniref:Uma2 family endonuclease n=1 Tax=Planktothricoides sp. SpSt-374 TaxID=2282167 RepID=A0A7C3ZXG3_9CYAN|nr:Uma2 family endonuclease [Oscillatoriaceae cyanobacterium M33_DOE_052]
MTASKKYFQISPVDYLAGERVSPIRHEYIRGEVYAMAGGSQAHGTIAGNMFALLRNHIRGTGCRAFIENMKVQIAAANSYYYPDVMVTCDHRDKNLADDFVSYPKLIVEVLSPSTAKFDRGVKFADYQQIETLQEYVLISSDSIQVDCYRRDTEGRWEVFTYEKGDELELTSVNWRGAIDWLYEDVLELE